MKIKKSELISALEVSTKMVDKGGATTLKICKTIMIDAAKNEITATNLDHRCVVDIGITDYTQMVNKSKPPLVLPEPLIPFIEADLQAELEALTVKELKGKYPEASGKKKPELIQAILLNVSVTAEKDTKAYDEQVVAAQAEWNALPYEQVAVDERICVQPGHLLKIVQSLEKGQEDVVIRVDEWHEDMYHEFSAARITVGEHFQSLYCEPADEFPSGWEFKEPQFFVKITGKALGWVAAGCTKEKDDIRDHVNNVIFDPGKGGLASTDGGKLHFYKTKLLKKNDKGFLPATTLRPLATLAKDEELTFSINGDHTKILIELGNVNVYVQNHLPGFPDISDLLAGTSTHTVTVKTADMENMLKQAKLMTTDEYRGLGLLFNGDISARLDNPDIGVYERLNVPIVKGEVKPEVEILMGVEKLQTAVAGMTENILVGVSDQENPLHIRSTPDEKFHAVVMPMRI